MTIEEAIKKAIEGGYAGPQRIFLTIAPSPWKDDTVDHYDIWTNCTFLEPSFWQSLGKSLEWGRLHCTNCRKFAISVRKNEDDPEYWANCCEEKRLDYGPSPKIYWHRFIDHLADGKDAKSFFATLQ